MHLDRCPGLRGVQNLSPGAEAAPIGYHCLPALLPLNCLMDQLSGPQQHLLVRWCPFSCPELCLPLPKIPTLPDTPINSDPVEYSGNISQPLSVLVSQWNISLVTRLTLCVAVSLGWSDLLPATPVLLQSLCSSFCGSIWMLAFPSLYPHSFLNVLTSAPRHMPLIPTGQPCWVLKPEPTTSQFHAACAWASPAPHI